MKTHWPWLALIVAVFLSLVQWIFGVRTPADSTGLPLLTALFINEFGLILCGGTAFYLSRILRKSGFQPLTAVQLCLCAAFALGFLWSLIRLYPV